ncbi:MAG TPA: hypothetical protein VHP54_06880 [Caproiciproducens sp.]|nr:hypothetical protein [Caproiciproducens sp.]
MILTYPVINYFISSNSSQGYVSFFQSGFGGLDTVIRLGGYPSMVASDLLSGICVRAQEKGLHPELIHNCLDNSLEGLILPERGAGIINYPLYDENAHHLAAILDDENLERTRSCLTAAHRHLAEALKIHDSWETVYISNMDFAVADRLAAEMTEKLIGTRRLEKKGVLKDRFFGALTVDGSSDYIDNLTANVQKRYFIKGRPGTGKSTFLRRIASGALKAGFDVESYHCAFDPDSLDMVILRELGVCLFDSTPPHEYFPSRTEDETIDFYKAAVAEKTDEKYRGELAAIMADYKAAIVKATKQLAKAKRYYDEVQRGYLSKIDAQALESTEAAIRRKILGE